MLMPTIGWLIQACPANVHRMDVVRKYSSRACSIQDIQSEKVKIEEHNLLHVICTMPRFESNGTSYHHPNFVEDAIWQVATRDELCYSHSSDSDQVLPYYKNQISQWNPGKEYRKNETLWINTMISSHSHGWQKDSSAWHIQRTFHDSSIEMW